MPLTDLLTMMATPAWAYLALFGLLAIDAMIPVVPIQAIMITSGALTVYGGLSLPLVIAVGALGMFTGDLICFVLGRTAGHSSGPGISGRLAALRHRFAPKSEQPHEPGTAKKAAARFTRGLRKPGPLVLLLCRFVPGGRMAAGYFAGRVDYPTRLFLTYDGLAATAWATYGGLVGHIGGTAVTQSAWRLFAVAATAAVIFGTAGWILALFGGRNETEGTRNEIHGSRNETEGSRNEAGGNRAGSHPPAQQAGGDDAESTGTGQADSSAGPDGRRDGTPAHPRPSGAVG